VFRGTFRLGCPGTQRLYTRPNSNPRSRLRGPLGVRQHVPMPAEKSIEPGVAVGRRVIVTGLAGAGKSTFSRSLSTKTGIPVIHLDVHCWKPGWEEPSEDEWRELQRNLLTGDEWIADGNYHSSLDLRLKRADTLVYLDTPWWVCALRAFMRGIRKRPMGFQPPPGCAESASRRLRDEWRLIPQICRVRRSERELELGILARQEHEVAVHVLRGARATRNFLVRSDR
jgi:hypothetical protein